MRERDTQRKRVYTCDRELAAFSKPLPTVPDMERYVKRVLEMQRIRNAFPYANLRPPQVKDGRGRVKAGGCDRYITMPLWSRTDAIVLHELAHTVTQRVHGHNVAAHGWQFCSIFLTLVLHGMGRVPHEALKASFKKHRVKFTKPREKRPMDPEKKAELIGRLAVWRARANAVTVDLETT